jgi:PAS domain S-box-containing protein/putative nucleotidyltransferase with HDIG domain
LRQLQQIFNTAADGMCLIDKGFHVIRANHTFARLFSLPPSQIPGKRCRQIMPGGACHTSGCCMRRILSGERRITFQTRKQRPDGSTFPCIVSASPFYNADNEVIGIVEDIRDITAIVASERKLRESHRRIRTTLDGTIQAISCAIETRDPYPAGHQRRVARIAAAIAREMGLSAHRIEGIRIAGLIHDIGKISIPASILAKPGTLTDKEFALIMEHPRTGYEILKSIDFPHPVAETVLQHHEKMDGSGYPRGLRSREILMEARIIAVADVLESMASHRPYRPTLGLKVALEEIIEKQDKLYDSRVVGACLRLVNKATLGQKGN